MNCALWHILNELKKEALDVRQINFLRLECKPGPSEMKAFSDLRTEKDSPKPYRARSEKRPQIVELLNPE